MILCDIGVKKHNLCSDITTTFPVNGKFTKNQKDIYDIVLCAQKSAIKAVKPGIPFKNVNMVSNEKLVEGLIKIGILKGEKSELLEKGVLRVFLPHSLSHYIGK